MAKGLRRKKNPYQGCMETLNHLEIVYFQKTQDQLGVFKECSLKHHFPQLRHDWPRLMTALYQAELVRKTTMENDANPKLFVLLRYCLYKLSNGANYQNILFYGQWHTLQLLGYSLTLTHCSLCGRTFDEQNIPVYFSPQHATVFCHSCRPHSNNLISCNSTAILKLQQMIQEAKSGALDSMQFKAGEFYQLQAMMTKHIHTLIDGELNLSRYFSGKI